MRYNRTHILTGYESYICSLALPRTLAFGFPSVFGYFSRIKVVINRNIGYYGYRTDNKKLPVKNQFLNLSIILDYPQAFSFYPSLADAN